MGLLTRKEERDPATRTKTTMEPEASDLVGLSSQSFGNKNEEPTSTLLVKVKDKDIFGSNNLCTSAKQYRKTTDDNVRGAAPNSVQSTAADSKEIQLTYTWNQTETEIIISMKISNVPDIAKVLDIYFTSKEAHISISDTEKHVITFHDLIEKELSKVQVLKGNVTMHLIKQRASFWPALEASLSDCGPSCDVDRNGDVSDNDKTSHVASIPDDEPACVDGDKNKAVDHLMTESKIEIEKIEQRQPEFMDKVEEPVYHLDHLKHDFFQKGSVLTLQVFTKSVNKDAVKIAFSSQGFVLKFCTSDQKFLHLHEGTNAETTFSWTVKTRKEILPGECKIKVKQAIIELLLHTATIERWASLEAPLRQAAEPTKSASWMPLNGALSQPHAPSQSASHSSSKVEPPSHSPLAGGSKKVMFDEMSEVDLANKEGKKKLADEGQDSSESNLSSLSDSIKFKSNILQDWNKPMAKVQPLNKIKDERVAVVSPGYAGLVNFGNTCFMNCVIQVLSNTREFRDYFLDGRFEEEINEDNPLGMKGHLASTFGTLLRWLWSCQKYYWEPRKLKDLISKKNQQFFGFAQHDAHEFLAFLMDGLHEDLNRIKQKPYTQTIDSNGRPDEVVAAEAWSLYKQRNDSVVVDMFQGQYKSKLVCPKCGKVSITFDPFLYLSVPLPKRMKLIHVTFLWKESYKKPVRYHIQLCFDSTVERLLEELSKRTGVNATDIRIFEAYKGRIHKFFLSGPFLSYVDDKTFIIACEILSEELAGEEVVEIRVVQRTLSPSNFPTQCAACDKYCNEGTSLKRCTNCYKVGYCNQACQRKHWTIHKSQCNNSQQAIGCPFIVSLPASRLTFGNLAKHMEGFARFSVNLFQPPVKTTETSIIKTPGPSASPVPPSNLSSALSQSSSSLNSLDSLSSASSTCTLTGDQSDSQIPEEGSEASVSDSDACGPPLPALNDSTISIDSGMESSSCKSEKGLPTSQVMGMPVKEVDREMSRSTFLIQPSSSEGTSSKGAEFIEDKGDTPLGLASGRFLAMVWRNNEKLPSYVLVQSKQLEAEEVGDFNSINNATNLPTLYQCLELFTEPEILNPEEAWFCPSCKKHVEASKQMAIWKLPHTLVIQLKRFSFQSFVRRSKIEKRVDFPTRGLDLRRYCVGLSPDEPSPVYDLYGVVNHHGHLIDGHYTSFVRCTSDGLSGKDLVDWRLCDDSRVTSVENEQSVVTKDAYLLFYRRRGMPAVINFPSSSETIPSCLAGVTPTVHPSPSGSANNTQVDSLSDDKDMQIPSYQPHSSNSSSSVNLHNLNSNKTKRPDLQASPSSQGTQGQDTPKFSLNFDPNLEDMARSRASDVDELKEKGDREKDFDDRRHSTDSDEDEPRLVIQTEIDLGYTDMEAVD